MLNEITGLHNASINTASLFWVLLWKKRPADFSFCNRLIFGYLDGKRIQWLPMKPCNLTKASQFWWSYITSSWNISYSLVSAISYHRFEHILFCFVLFCCLLLELFYLYVGSLCSNLLICHLLYLLSSTCLFLCFCAVFEVCFPHQLCFWFVDCTFYNFNIFISSAKVFLCHQFLSTASSPFIWCLIILSLIFSSTEFLLIVIYKFLLYLVLSKYVAYWYLFIYLLVFLR